LSQLREHAETPSTSTPQPQHTQQQKQQQLHQQKLAKQQNKKQKQDLQELQLQQIEQQLELGTDKPQLTQQQFIQFLDKELVDSKTKPGNKLELSTETFEALKAAKNCYSPPLTLIQKDKYLNFYKRNSEGKKEYLFSYPDTPNTSYTQEADDEPLMLS